MTIQSFSTTILINQSPEQAFNAINNVRGWWSEEIEGGTHQLNDEFNYHYLDVHRCKIKLTELIPGKKVAWFVMDNYFKFTTDNSEWPGTTIIFDISRQDNKTSICFTHEGLVPAFECYEICRDAWTNYIQHSLYNLIATGKGQPNASGSPQTEDERQLAAG